jgi:hypothetical protein
MFECFAKDSHRDTRAAIISGKCSRMNAAINKKRYETGLGLWMRRGNPSLAKIEEEKDISKSESVV